MVCQSNRRENSSLIIAGIGKGFAQELSDQGFNVVLHGRNEAKLKDVQSDLERQWPQRKYQLLILDAEADSKDTAKMEAEIARITSLNIRVLINNVAGGGKHEKPVFNSLVERQAENINGWLDISSRFPTQFTRILLPTLLSKQPALIVNVGSGVSEFAVPYIGTYSGCKAYNKAWSRCLALELEADKHDVEVIAIIVGEVATERSKRIAALNQPTPRQMAKASLHVVGSGARVIAAYWFHAVQLALIDTLPQWIADPFAINVAIEERKKEEAERAKLH